MVRSDAIDVQGCRDLNPNAIVVSPGPRRPEDAGCSVDVIRHYGNATPILGVCLGHQSIGQAFGARIITAGPMHGVSSQITHDASGVFHGCPSPMAVGRYHSLVIDPDSVTEELVVTARNNDGVIMGIRHRDRPIHGVQFHPESVLTDRGMDVIGNFVAMADVATGEPVL